MVLFYHSKKWFFLRSDSLDEFAARTPTPRRAAAPAGASPARFRDGADLITHPTHRRPNPEACFGLFYGASATNGAPLRGGSSRPSTLNEAGRLDACLTRYLRGRRGRLLSSAAPTRARRSRTSGRLMFCGRRSGRRRRTLSGHLSAGSARRRRALRSSCGLSTTASLRVGHDGERACGRRVCRAGGARP